MSDKPQHWDRGPVSDNLSDQDEVTDALMSDDLMDLAIAWHARKGVDDPNSDIYAEFREWCQRSPDHQIAADKVNAFMADDGFNNLLAGLEAELQTQPGSPNKQARKPASRNFEPAASRTRRLVRRMGLFAGIAATLSVAAVIALSSLNIAGGGDRDQRLVAERYAIHQTLSDGSRITLAPGAVVSWAMTSEQRHLHLEEGAITIEASPDKNRPMVVSTAYSDVTVVGTQFIVISDPHGDEIGVAEGIVRVRERQSGEFGEVTLTAGQGIILDQTGKLIRREITAAQIEKVSEGWRLFASKPLVDVAAAIRRQSGIKLVIDPGVADRLVRGRLNVADGEKTIGLLVKSLKVNRYDLPFGYVLLTDRI
ncbi:MULTISPECIES: FecR family protein [Thalassospira]|uniref:FecR domain-containing protein n=1 Tax=Thalassospira aquimaris TaxID=3037796 RepID=A0ABT6GDV0_9PROT|nr:MULTISPECIES: FecR domain-containing protein [Thalassospira]MDG4720002.1 FecR domain-containing protein [Thalassospira sp. FZY0004]